MVLGGFRGLTYADGYAGPGEYTGGEPGSPIIALEQVLDRPDVLAKNLPMRFAFTESDDRRYKRLRGVVNRRWPRESRPAHVTLHGVAKPCEEELIPLLTKIGAWGQPILANLDGFGAPPLSIVQRIGQNLSSEVIVTFPVDFFVRFAQTGPSSADGVFGSTAWRDAAALTTKEKKPFLIAKYRDSLRSAGFAYTASFEMLDEGGHEIVIFYGTQKSRGLEVWKDAMWKVDRVYGVRFRDPRDPNQTSLDISFDSPNLSPLRRQILRDLGDGRQVTVDELRRLALFETVYRPTHAHQLVRDLVRQGTLMREPTTGQVSRATTVWLA
jgi:three-Cys-motif partner protein